MSHCVPGSGGEGGGVGVGITETPGENKQEFEHAGCHDLTAPEIRRLQN